MSIEEFVKIKINDNKLDLDYVYVIDNINDMIKNNHPRENDKELFYYCLRNILGQIILSMDGGNVTRTEMMGWLTVKTSIFDDKEMQFFRFETVDDYYTWLNIRKELYKHLTDFKEIRIVNFIELSTFDFISDNLTNGKYLIYNNDEKIKIQKTGMICNHNKMKFIKVLVDFFNNNYIYKPI